MTSTAPSSTNRSFTPPHTMPLWSAGPVSSAFTFPIHEMSGTSELRALTWSSSQRYNLTANVARCERDLQRGEEDERKLKVLLRDLESATAGFRRRQEEMEAYVSERAHGRGMLAVDALMAQAGERVSPEAQAHYDEVISLREQSASVSLVKLSSLSLGSEFQPSGVYQDYLARPPPPYIPTHEAKQPSCLSTPYSKFTDLDGIYLDPRRRRAQQWGPSFPRNLDHAILRGGNGGLDHLLLALHVKHVRAFDTYVAWLKDQDPPVTQYEVWLPRGPEDAGWEYAGTYKLDDTIGTVPFTRSETGYLPSLFAGQANSSTEGIRWKNHKLAWIKGTDKYVFRVLRCVGFNQAYFDMLDNLPPVVSSRKRTRAEVSGSEIEPAHKVPRLYM